MGLKKISDGWKDIKKLCIHPEHEPPRNYVYEAGTYEYTCPGCKYKTTFTVNPITC